MHGERGLADEERVAVIVPCLDEAITIGKVVDDWRRALPDAEVWVVDNGSTDGTAEIAASHGARVIHESRRGKGFAMRTAFRRIDADVYVMVDGDDTYPAESAEVLLAPIREGRADMTVGSRLMKGTASEFRALNRLANWFYPFVIRMLVHVRLTDVLSGMRAMTREFVEGVPLVAQGFEIEVELTVKAAERHFRIAEVPIDLRPRPEGSFSKVSLVGDGSRVLWTIVMLFRDYRPMAFFGAIGLLLMLVGLIPGIVVIVEFLETGLVPRLPSAVLAVALELAGMLSIAVGILLSAVAHRFQELESRLEMLVGRPTRDR
jgi:glycosyltransferase involved in cell wall biosynthesis